MLDYDVIYLDNVMLAMIEVRALVTDMRYIPRFSYILTKGF